MLPTSTDRVPRYTSDAVNRQIRRLTLERLAEYEEESAEAISRRIEELDREWDIERTLEANAATLALVGVSLGAFVNRKWLILPAAVTGFLLQHALQGWCPPVPVLRRLGFRTPQEIDREKYALKALRGDFEEISDRGRRKPRKMLEAIER